MPFIRRLLSPPFPWRLEVPFPSSSLSPPCFCFQIRILFSAVLRIGHGPSMGYHPRAYVFLAVNAVLPRYSKPMKSRAAKLAARHGPAIAIWSTGGAAHHITTMCRYGLHQCMLGLLSTGEVLATSLLELWCIHSSQAHPGAAHHERVAIHHAHRARAGGRHRRQKRSSRRQERPVRHRRPGSLRRFGQPVHRQSREMVAQVGIG